MKEECPAFSTMVQLRRSARQAAAAATAAAATAAAAKESAPAAGTPKTPPRPKKRSKTHGGTKPSSPPSKKTKHTGLETAVSDTATSLGVVDPESNIQGEIVTSDEEPCDVMLVLVDPAKNMDKFFILQLIETTQGGYSVYSRWGRTGTKGQAMQQDFDDYDGAEDCFLKKFSEKTGLEWQERNEPIVGGKYRYIQQDFKNKQAGFTGALWQYWVDDGVDGKPDGWYDYDPAGSVQAERLFAEYLKNTGLSHRWVESGFWIYDVDLANMTQTNVRHANHTVRRIRRVPVGPQMPDNAPSFATPPTPISSGSMASVSTPITSGSMAAVIAPLRAPSSSGDLTHPPVDPDVSLYDRHADDFEVVAFAEDPSRYYDAVLNQCDITASNNNNKYYRIQMLCDTSSDEFFVWQKWGRVGEQARKSSSALKGPFSSEEKALKEYSKKFKDKTGNAYDTDNFISNPGKYTLIHIDNNIKVEECGSSDVAIANSKYEPSKLDSKTQELVQVLFSKDMRDEALTNFNLDLKRLPLGVPSQQQIQQGIDILKQIGEKLGDDDAIHSSFDQLSSQFYTAIPHSFGRSRPPVIDTEEKLQSRYDMCDILLDMLSTSETIRRLEEHESSNKNSVLPNPLDKQYETLHAKLTLLDKQSSSFKKIADYFNKTRSSRPQLLDVWEVDREGEAKRFKSFDKLGNRKLLFHGTNIAVVAPILTSGLRIMPHSGGRVGAGIYLASLQEKSAQYTCGYGSKFACMFLCEATLGKMHSVTNDTPSLKKAPKGFDSVHAVGKRTPKKWGKIQLDGKQVLIPSDGPEEHDVETSFFHDEFLCYNESQVHLRYILTVRE